MTQTTKTEFDWTLPSRDYRDPALFERERREIFAANWMLFSWSERLRESGDYVTGTVAGYPVFAIRDDAGQVRAFHNVCRHRGAQLLGESSGRCGKLVVCPYHSWSYTRDGRLNKAFDFGSDAAFDPDALGPPRDRRRGMARPRLSQAEARRPEPGGVARPDPRGGVATSVEIGLWRFPAV